MINFGGKKKNSKTPYSDVIVEVSLKYPDKDSYIEVNFRKLVCSKRANALNIETSMSEQQDENADIEDVSKMAEYFEKKYGSRSGILSEDWTSLAYGYDEDDPLIDNSEALDDILPPTMSTEHGGFYVNCGKLKLQRCKDFQFGNAENDDNCDENSMEDVDAHEDKVHPPPKKRSKKPTQIHEETKVSHKKSKSRNKGECSAEPSPSKIQTKNSQNIADEKIENDNILVLNDNQTPEVVGVGSSAENAAKADETLAEIFKDLEEEKVSHIQALLDFVKTSNEFKRIFSNPEAKKLLLAVYHASSDLPFKVKAKLNLALADKMNIGKNNFTKCLRTCYIKEIKDEVIRSLSNFSTLLASVSTGLDEEPCLPSDAQSTLEDIVTKSLQLFSNTPHKIHEFKNFLSTHFKNVNLNTDKNKIDLRWLMIEVKKLIPPRHFFHENWDNEEHDYLATEKAHVSSESQSQVEPKNSPKTNLNDKNNAVGNLSSVISATQQFPTPVIFKPATSPVTTKGQPQNLPPQLVPFMNFENQERPILPFYPHQNPPISVVTTGNLNTGMIQPLLHQSIIPIQTISFTDSPNQWTGNRPCANIIRTTAQSIRFIPTNQIRPVGQIVSPEGRLISNSIQRTAKIFPQSQMNQKKFIFNEHIPDSKVINHPHRPHSGDSSEIQQSYSHSNTNPNIPQYSHLRYALKPRNPHHEAGHLAIQHQQQQQSNNQEKSDQNLPKNTNSS